MPNEANPNTNTNLVVYPKYYRVFVHVLTIDSLDVGLRGVNLNKST